jgi:hypothetical protein
MKYSDALADGILQLNSNSPTINSRDMALIKFANTGFLESKLRS